MYRYLIEEENKHKQEPKETLEDLYNSLYKIYQTLEKLADEASVDTLEQLKDGLSHEDDTAKVIKNVFKDINKDDLQQLVDTKEEAIYSCIMTSNTPQQLSEGLMHLGNSLSVIHDNEEYTLDSLADLLNN